MYDHSCYFRRPDYECETCGLYVMEYVEGLEDRNLDLDKKILALEAEVKNARERLGPAGWKMVELASKSRSLIEAAAERERVLVEALEWLAQYDDYGGRKAREALAVTKS